MNSNEIRKYIELRVKENIKTRKPSVVGDITEKRQDLIDRGLSSSTIWPNHVVSALVHEAFNIILDTLQIGVKSFLKAQGEVFQQDRDWLLVKCEEISNRDPEKLLGTSIRYDQQIIGGSKDEIIGVFRQKLNNAISTEDKLEILISEHKLNEIQKHRGVPFYNRWWWQGIFAAAALGGLLALIMQLLNSR